VKTLTFYACQRCGTVCIKKQDTCPACGIVAEQSVIPIVHLAEDTKVDEPQ
jgi:uncharacterized OB-fold protein